MNHKLPLYIMYQVFFVLQFTAMPNPTHSPRDPKVLNSGDLYIYELKALIINYNHNNIILHYK